MTQCGELGDAIRTLGEPSTKASRGKETIDKTMNPIRKIIEEEKFASGARKSEIKNELMKQYSDVPTSTDKMTTEKRAITQDILTDSDVKEYIGQMNYDEYANFRSELQGVFGGAQARLAEIEFKNAKIPRITEALKEKELYTDTINDAFSTMKGEGILSDRDLNKLRALENLSNEGLDTIKTGTARQTYNSMKSTLGEEITNDIFTTKIEKNLRGIKEKYSKLTTQDKLFKKAPTKDELKIFEDIATGKRKPDGNSLEASYRMLDKMSAESWDAIRGTIKPLDELDSAQRASVISNIQNKESKTSKMKKAAAGTLSLMGVAITALYAIPQSLLWFGTSTPTNIAEMTGLYEQFKTGKESMDAIDKKLLCPTCMSDMNTFLTNLENTLDGLPYSLFLSIPIYGDYVRSYIETPINDNINAIQANYERMFTELEALGLVKRANNALGFEQTTDNERAEYYKKDMSTLFKTKDEKWVQKYGELVLGKNGFSSSETPDGRPMTATQAMIYYMSLEGKDGAEYGSDLGVSDRTKNWEQNNPSFVEKVRSWGSAKESELERESSTSGMPPAKGTYTLDELKEIAIQNAMKRNGMNREQATRNVEEEVMILQERGGKSELSALMTLTGKSGEDYTYGKSSGGGRGGSTSGSSSKSSETKTERRKYTEELAKKDLNTVSREEKERVTKEMSFKEVKEQNSETTLSDYTSDMSASEKKAKVKEYVREEVETMSKEEVNEAAVVDKEATAAAIIDSVCGGS